MSLYKQALTDRPVIGFLLVELALAASTRKRQVFLFLYPLCALKGDSWSQGFLAETVETGDKNRVVTENIKFYNFFFFSFR